MKKKRLNTREFMAELEKMNGCSWAADMMEIIG